MRLLGLVSAVVALSACPGEAVVVAADGSVDADAAETSEPEALEAVAGAPAYALVGEAVVLDGAASTGAAGYHWDFGNGAGADGVTVEATYDAPGRYKAVLTVTGDDGATRSDVTVVAVTWPAVWQPRQSSTIARLPGADDRFVVVSHDGAELTRIERAGDGFELGGRVATAPRPATIATSGPQIAVACEGEVQLFDGELELLAHGSLPSGARGHGVVAAGGAWFVTLQALGEVARLERADDALTVTDRWPVVPDARGIAALPDGRLAITRWRSPDERGELALLDPADGAVELLPLAFDPQASSDTEVGGVPSYLEQLLVSPTGRIAALPSLQANIAEGLFLDGTDPAHDTVLRAVVSYLDLTGDPVETPGRRRQLDNRGLASAGVFSSRGDWLFVAARGTRKVDRVDVLSDTVSGSLLDVGYAPEGLALTADDRFLLVDASLSREVVVYDVGSFDTLPLPVARLPSVTAEPLDPALLAGKRLFNDAADKRLTRDGYLACAHCHLEGESDHRTWDFTDRGEGLRNTTSLLGRAGTAQGPIHWSGNFDEIQDFEHDIREHFGGRGFLADADYESGGGPLGTPKAGLDADLDDLAAYVASFATHRASPFRQPDGGLGEAATRGKAVFESAETGCTTCHAGPELTDSAWTAPGEPLLHDVGTLGPGSGQRLGGPLVGIDTPTLHGVWNSGPYLHDGSAATLEEVLTARNPDDLHGATSQLSAGDVADLVAYLSCLDGRAD